MLGAGFAYLLAQVTGFIKRQAVIYGLMAATGLTLIFAAGYGLDAARAALMIRVGGVYASLIIGGVLLVVALGCFGAAIYLNRAHRPTATIKQASSPYSNPPRRPLITGPAIVAGGAITGLIAGVFAAKWPRRRQNLMCDAVDNDDRAPRR